MSDVTEFGFEDTKLIKPQGIELFSLTRSGEVAKVSLVAFKKVSDVILAQKAREKEAPLTDEEKAGYIAKIDQKLKEQYGRELTEVDRLDIKSPRFSFAWTHYDERVGTIRCLSKYESSNVVKRDICCNEFGDADQTIATIVMVYPTEKDGTIDLEDFFKKKRVEFQLLKMTQKKFSRIEAVYKEARSNELPVIDLKLTLDGEPKYKKFSIENSLTAAWAKKDVDPELRNWVLDQGLRSFKYVDSNLGYKMTRDKLVEKLGGSSGSSGGHSEAAAEKPKIEASYDALLTD